MRGDFTDEARRFEDLDKEVLKEIEAQRPDALTSPDWLARQSIDTLSDLLEAVTEELARRRAAKGGGY